MKVKHELKLLYFQVDEGLVCMDIVSTFHIIVIIYQNFNVKICWKNLNNQPILNILFIHFPNIKIL
jgi:hypothetical protein